MRSWRAAMARLGLALSTMAAIACADPGVPPDPEPDEPAEITVSAVEGARTCAGTRAWIAAEIERVQTEVGLLPVAPLLITLGATAVTERCTAPDDPETVEGCTQGEGGAVTVTTTPEAFSHELVHALRRQQELRTRIMFEEGFAEAIDGSDAYPRHGALDPSTLPEARWPEQLVQHGKAEFRSAESYRVATHFVDHLRAEHGPEAVAAFMRGGIDGSAEAATARFATHFGATLASEAQAWREAGLQSFGRGDPCTAGVAAIAPDTAVELAERVDCDDPATFGLQGAGERAWVRHCVSTSVAGGYDVELAASAGVVRWEAVPGTCAEDAAGHDAAPKLVEAGATGTLELAACTWAVTFESTADAPEAFVLSLRPR